jgi:hypothetical protein
MHLMMLRRLTPVVYATIKPFLFVICCVDGCFLIIVIKHNRMSICKMYSHCCVALWIGRLSIVASLRRLHPNT